MLKMKIFKRCSDNMWGWLSFKTPPFKYLIIYFTCTCVCLREFVCIMCAQ